MRSSTRIPTHRLAPTWHPPKEPSDAEEGEDRFRNRPCYVFNPSLKASMNDQACGHCRFYLTASCPHIDEFIDDVEDLSPD
ncbi:MAG TPA: hypothetical protein VGP88_01105 [Thermoplasmata archaeon]|nr:hypothetical protein [Thermoplasmata archaeon]